jgi:hypothetical protein
MGTFNAAGAEAASLWYRPDTHQVPETSSDERMHVLTRDCWCHPRITAGDSGAFVTHIPVRRR